MTTEVQGAAERQHRTDELMMKTLQFGVVAAAALVIFGGGLFLARHGAGIPHYAAFRGEPADLRRPDHIVHFALNLHSRGIIQLGLFLLILNPIFRVVMSAVTFVRQRDYLYIGITLIVLGVLLYNLLGSLH